MKFFNNFDSKSIKFRLWCSILSVALLILGLVWLCQIYLLRNSYENMKIQQVEKTATLISQAYQRQDKNLTSEIIELSVTSDLYVMMESRGVLLLFTPEEDSTLPVYKYKNQVPILREMATNGDKSSYSYDFSSNFENYDTLAYCKVIGSQENVAYLYIFTPLYPLSSTIDILKDQLFMVTILVLLVAFLIASILSTKLSYPLTKITEGAKKIGQGDYDIKLDTHSSYTEINKLSSTLNRAALDLGRADNLQRDIISNVSHDLKTPLTLIRSYAEMIRDLSGDDKIKREEHLNTIINETERMASLVSDMSELSKMQNKKIELNLNEFDLSILVKEVVQSYSVLEEKEGYIFKTYITKEAIVNADEQRIKQVVTNLLGNAIKYCGDNKEITIRLRKSGKAYRLEIIDKGPGIPEDDIPHIWDKYYRSSKNYHRTEEGSGLGLYIVKQILTLHNSDFGVNSELGNGSTFYFELEGKKK